MTRAEIQDTIASAIRNAPRSATAEYVAQQAAGNLCTIMAVEALQALLPSERAELFG